MDYQVDCDSDLRVWHLECYPSTGWASSGGSVGRLDVWEVISDEYNRYRNA